MNTWIPTLGLIVNLVPAIALAYTTVAPAAPAIPDLNSAAVSTTLSQVSLADRSEGCERRYRAGWMRMTSRPSERRADRQRCIAAAEASARPEPEPAKPTDVDATATPAAANAAARPPGSVAPVAPKPEPNSWLPPVAAPDLTIDWPAAEEPR